MTAATRAGALALVIASAGCELIARVDRAREREADFARCHDGVDNDESGLRDCDEPSCAAYCLCVPEEVACNGRDDDCDGRVDEVDWAESFEAPSPRLTVSGALGRARIVAGTHDGESVLGQRGECVAGAKPSAAEIGGIPGGLDVHLWHRLIDGAVSPPNGTPTVRRFVLRTQAGAELDRFETVSVAAHDWEEVVLDGTGAPGPLVLRIEGLINRCTLGVEARDNQWQIDDLTAGCPTAGTMVFSSDEGHPGVTTIWAVSGDGRAPREIGPQPGDAPRLAPDGRTVYFVDADRYLRRTALDGSAAAALVAGSAQPAQVGVSPDGTRVAYADAADCSATRLRIVSAASGALLDEVWASPPLDGTYTFVGPDWSARDLLVFTPGCDHRGSVVGSNLYVAPAAAGAMPAAVPGGPAPVVRNPRFSPDGGRVLYALPDADILGRGDIRRLEVIAITGGAPVVLHDERSKAEPASLAPGGWSPDGRRVVFSRRPVNGPAELWIVRSDGRRPAAPFLRPPSGLTAGYGAPDWRP